MNPQPRDYESLFCTFCTGQHLGVVTRTSLFITETYDEYSACMSLHRNAPNSGEKYPQKYHQKCRRTRAFSSPHLSQGSARVRIARYKAARRRVIPAGAQVVEAEVLVPAFAALFSIATALCSVCIGEPAGAEPCYPSCIQGFGHSALVEEFIFFSWIWTVRLADQRLMLRAYLLRLHLRPVVSRQCWIRIPQMSALSRLC